MGRLLLGLLLIVFIHSFCFMLLLLLRAEDTTNSTAHEWLEQAYSSLGKNGPSSSTNTAITTKPSIEERCALCFFGLPRSYKTMVLPSIQKNILQPNAKYHCDVFVHYFHQEKELAGGRFNPGGILDPTEILLLKDVVQNITPNVTIQFIHDTDTEFFQRRKNEFHRYDTTIGHDGIHLAYYPWKEENWSNMTQINLIRQWHSIERAFELMEQNVILEKKNQQKKNIHYNRVAMLRNDVMFLTPVDIMKLDHEQIDIDNNHVILPAFANYPVNDRMIYGPYEAVKIWATKRFELLEERVKDPNVAGYVLHSERFVNESILPHIQQQQKRNHGYHVYFNPDLCFVRTRANSVTVFNDCVRGKTAVRKQLQNPSHLRHLVEEIYGHKCQHPQSFRENKSIKYISCK